MKSPQRGAASPQQQLEEAVDQAISMMGPDKLVFEGNRAIIIAAKAYALAIVEEIRSSNGYLFLDEQLLMSDIDDLAAQLRSKIEGR